MSAAGRRRSSSKNTSFSAEDQALHQIAEEADVRHTAKRAVRTEAREIRMREIEKKQKEDEEKQRQERLAEGTEQRSSARSYTTPRRGSEDALEDRREMRSEIHELEEKYKKAMVMNAQLDNEKQKFRYQVENLKDLYEELEEKWLELQRQQKETARELERWKRQHKDLEQESVFLKDQLEQRDRLIEEHGLVFVSNEAQKEKGKGKANPIANPSKTDNKGSALVTPEAAQILDQVGGSLDERLKKFAQEKTLLQEEIKKLKQQLEAEREKNAYTEKYSSPKTTPKVNGPDPQAFDAQLENQRILSDCKFKLMKAEQEITTYEGTVIRLESQVKRYKSAAENAERSEEDLKVDNRKIKRELRESQNLVDELKTSNSHLQKRLEKLKAGRNALTKS